MTFEAYIANSRAIFERFENQQLWLQGGLIPNRQLQMPEAGYCVVIRYDEKTTKAISRFMRKVYTVLPPVVEYNERSFHTTIGTFDKGERKGFVPDFSIYKRLAKSVETGLKNRPANPKVIFKKWLFNNETILISGYPNQDLWYLSQRIADACQENEVPLERGRIIHITTARFIQGVSRQVFDQFLLLMETAPVIKPTKLRAIDIASWRCDGLTFEIATYARYAL